MAAKEIGSMTREQLKHNGGDRADLGKDFPFLLLPGEKMIKQI